MCRIDWDRKVVCIGWVFVLDGFQGREGRGGVRLSRNKEMDRLDRLG